MERMLEVLLRRRDRGDSSSDEEEEVPLMESDELETEEDQETSAMEEPSTNTSEMEGASTSEMEGEERLMEAEQQNAAAQTKEKKWEKKSKTEFDISLPARHLYLGDLDEEEPAKMEDEETTPTLPLLCIPSRILFPGETLPMHIYNPHMIEMLRDACTRGKPVAICTDLRLRYREQHLAHQVRPTQEELSEIGTTAEVVGFKEEESPYFAGQCFIVKFLGRQRYRLLELHRKVNGLMDCRVEILPEQYLPPSPVVVTSACPTHVHASCRATQMLARQPECTMYTGKQLEKCRKRLQNPYLTCLSPIPAWAFTQYNTDFLREQLMMEQELKTFRSEEATSARLPGDVTSLSYWLARRLPTDENKKLELLSMNCPTLRLIRGLQILREFTDFCCSFCQAVIAQKQHMFSMSVEGPLAAYVNPGGYVHDTLTLTEAKGLKKQGSPSTEHSWFPGYKWTILNCRGCGHHKGWRFEATKRNLVPAKFYGLTRDGLVLTSANKTQDTAG